MKNTLVLGTAKLVLPPLLGAAGALLATLLPAYHSAFCAGSSLPVGL